MAKLFNWHWLATVAKTVGSLAAILLSAILSYTFFKSISPQGMDIFPFAALSLTEGGLVVWIVIFAAMKHHLINSLIALIMIVACFVTTIAVTLAELIQLFQDHSLVDNATVVNGTLILLEAMLALHILAALSDFLVGKIEWLLKTWKPAPKEVDEHPPAQPQLASLPQQDSTPVPQTEPMFDRDQVKQMIFESTARVQNYYLEEIAKLQASQNGHAANKDDAFPGSQTK